MDKKEEIRNKIEELQIELNKIIKDELFIANRNLVGKYFKYKNCYSLPENESDYWYVYQYVIKFNLNKVLQSFYFEVDANGKVMIYKDSAYVSEKWIEITKQEFDIAWYEICDLVSHICE